VKNNCVKEQETLTIIMTSWKEIKLYKHGPLKFPSLLRVLAVMCLWGLEETGRCWFWGWPLCCV